MLWIVWIAMSAFMNPDILRVATGCRSDFFNRNL